MTFTSPISEAEKGKGSLSSLTRPLSLPAEVELQERSNITCLVKLQAQERPEAIALKVKRSAGLLRAQTYHAKTFQQLDSLIDQAVVHFNSHSIAPETRVLVMVKPGLDLLIVVFALLRMGAIPIVIDPGMGLKAFLKCVQRSQPEALVGTRVAWGLSRCFPKAFGQVRIRLLAHQGPWHRPALPVPQAALPVYLKAPEALAAILFTSGSTGFPKGVCYTHALFEAQLSLIAKAYTIAPGEVDLSVLPVFSLFSPALGMTSVIPEINPRQPSKVKVRQLVQTFQACQVTTSFSGPAVWQKVVAYCLNKGLKLPTLRRILVAGAPVYPELLTQLQGIAPNAILHIPYGATESLPLTTITASEALSKAQHSSKAGAGTCVGKPLPGISIAIIPVEDQPTNKLEFLLPYAVGEVIAQGPNVALMYDQLSEASESRILKTTTGVWARLGDSGYLDSEGQLWLCGRIAEWVVTPNGTFYPICCEVIFNQHPAVNRSALIAWRQGPKRMPAIVIEPRPPSFPKTKQARQQFINELQALADAQALTRPITTFFFHKNFPVDARHNAKIHRLALAKHFAQFKGVLCAPP